MDSPTASFDIQYMFPLHTLVEIVETRSSRMANDYLNHGYVLVGIHPTSNMVPANAPKRENPWVRRGVQYVLGRTDAVASFVALPRGQEALPKAEVAA